MYNTFIGMNAYGYSLLAAMVWGIAPLFEKYALGRADLIGGLIYRSWGVFFGSLLLLWLYPSDTPLLRMPPAYVACFVIAGILASLVGQVFAYNAIRLADVSQVTPIMGAWPALVILLSWLIFREPLTVRKIFGSGLIIFGVWMLRF